MSYTIFNKCKIDKSRVPKCYAMTTNLRLKNPTCRAYIFKRLLSYVFNQINNSIMVLIKTVGQKNKTPRLRDLAAKNSRIRDAKKHKKTRFRDSFKTPPRFRDWHKNFRDPEFSGYHSPPLVLIVFDFKRTLPNTWRFLWLVLCNVGEAMGQPPLRCPLE